MYFNNCVPSEHRMVTDLHNLKVFLHIPYSMLRPNLCVQAVHLNADTLSEQAKSFKLKINADVQGGL